MSFVEDGASLARLCDHGLRTDPSKVALIQDDWAMTYGELEERVNRVANGLRSLDLRPLERVLIPFENDIRFPEVLLGVVRAGGVAVPVNPLYRPGQHVDLARDSGSRIVIGSEAAAESILACLSDAVAETGIIVNSPGQGATDYDDWLASSSPQRIDDDTSGQGLCLQAYTSGSTGRPKGVLLSHHHLLHNAVILSDALDIHAESRVLLSTPLFHLNAGAVGLIPCLAQGGSAVILRGFDPDLVVDAVQTHGCTYTTGVPATYKLVLAAAQQRPTLDVSSLEFLVVGSAPMPKALLEELVETLPGVDVVEGYGLTECGPVVMVTPRGVDKLGSIGRPLPCFECVVVDTHGVPVPPGEVGELLLRSECSALGYHNRPEEQALRFRDGWVHTGDLVDVDDEGWFTFRGRVDDQMSVGGESVYPAEVENVIATHPEVRDVCVVPVSHTVKGQVPTAFVVLGAESTLSEHDLVANYLELAPAYSHPRAVYIVDSLPLGPTGKTDRQSLQKRAEDAMANRTS